MERRVETGLGTLAGAEVEGIVALRGIPFARPPLGPLRFRPPEPPEPWAGVRDARASGPVAPQVAGMIGSLLGERTGEQSEDCLTLNVWTPVPDGARRPVLVWIHGGGFVHGSGSAPIYDGAELARRGDAVVVTINYRLGALGFLDPGALTRAAGDPNRGLLDQVAALEWVRDHIEAFGGDPGCVTVFGESAGAMSISALLAMPAARGLFQRAILQSGALHSPPSRESAARIAHAFLGELGLDAARVERLCEVPVDNLMEVQSALVQKPPRGTRGLPFQPCVDGEVLPDRPLDAVRAGSAPGVAILTGTNLDEWKLFGLSDSGARELDRAGLVERVARAVRDATPAPRDAAESLVDAYTRARTGLASIEPPELWFALETDRFFRIPSIRLAEAQAAHAPGAYTYLFTWSSPALRGSLGSCHALELPFVFGSHHIPALGRFVGEGPAVRELSVQMQEAWLAFARSGDPTTPALDPWPSHDGTHPTMELGEKCALDLDPLGEERRAWDALL